MPCRFAIALALPLLVLAVPALAQSPPEAVDDLYTTPFEETLSVDPPGVLANDSDADFDALTAELVQGPDHGNLRFDPDGGFEYEPDGGFVGVDTFLYVAIAADGSDQATVTIEVGLGGGNVVTYTDEALFLADLAALGLSRTQEDFESEATWGDVRSDIVGGNHTAPEKTRLGITWTTNNDTSEVTTSEGAARRGQWGFYSLPHGKLRGRRRLSPAGQLRRRLDLDRRLDPVCGRRLGAHQHATGEGRHHPRRRSGQPHRLRRPGPDGLQLLRRHRRRWRHERRVPRDGGQGRGAEVHLRRRLLLRLRPGLHLAAKGICPGDVVVDFVGATPSGSVALVGAAGPGTTVVPGGPCPGVVIDLAAPSLLTTLGMPPSGDLSVIRTLGGGVCGRLLQALDLGTCGTSEVAVLP